MTTTPEARTAQLAAIEESGWGRPFRLVQPRNLAFWVYLLGVGGGALAVVRYFGPGAHFYRPALTGGVLLFGLYLVPWLLLLRHQNRYTAQPATLLAAAFAWGGLAATFWIALPANTALLEIWTKLGSTAFASDWAAGLTAPINEEFGKALGLALLIGLAPRLVRGAYDGFIIGAFIGLGFQVFEDVLYVYNGAAQTFGTDQLGSSFQIFVFRGVAGIVSHALFSAIFCAGLMWVLGRTPGERNVPRGVLTMLAAMVFHFAWDDMAGLSGGIGAVAVVLPFAIAALELITLFYVLRHAARQERTWIRQLLQPEADAGVLDPALLGAVSGLRKDRKAFRKLVHGRRRARHLLEGASDLARELARSRGSETGEVAHARAELLRLRGGGQVPM
ncbi:PrsW family intramembrane metalloprotease [Lentzea flaviverrucosa]|uniref:Membrane proteinase PrsW, cleaves anti-sigma factor RsiW, M82 family n=1 Tax=Lentzea flaviverrucosa TaxID=200379 RepID=A0A1H9A582_9PSEU|nr:PrsW family intramembrane metalloprotease [Lentzea flaviverrucosa]RDI32161.1 RsiW-degrading membrane proteinase PrsW (M82 family) [Lentzea flaviverrucosa]SEP71850.1 Membrane proteinase PrsW, cleaves anti-sigma factor RsiW, M82 family [Lentzea flaviverrucosa]